MPFYYYQRHPHEWLTLGSLALLPPYYIHLGKKDDKLFHIWPLYGKLQKGSYTEYSTLWPLFRFGSDPKNRTRLDHVLFYYHKAEKEKSLTSIFPLWWHQETPRTTNDASVLLHWYDNDKAKGRKDLTFLWLFPPEISLVKYQQGPAHLRHTVFPLYSYQYDQIKNALHWTLLWPLFSYSSGEEFFQQTSLLWKVISYEQRGKESSEFRFLWRLIRNKKTDKSYTFEFNPLYYYESEKGKGSYFAILGGLFGVETTRDQSKKVRFLWIFD
ncbi:MAG: hypothetical protein JSV09_10700 [Thermoplasmata archaeon]|nr:MAG: hypothetical protein JSV09_10700 [Thermoplasmata archaeon]